MTDSTERFRRCAALHSGFCWGKNRNCRRTGHFDTVKLPTLDDSAQVTYTTPIMKHLKTVFAKQTAGVLTLEDGRCFSGISVGHEGLSAGEVVFNTAMTGYQEVITDPSYAGQIVAMTAPQIGNVGMNPEDSESDMKSPLRGLVMRELSPRVSNWRATESLPDFLKRHQIVALAEIDTRSLTQHLRDHGPKRGVIASGDWDTEELVRKAKESPRIEDIDFVGALTVSQVVEWSEPNLEVKNVSSKKIIVFDFGVKRSILRALASQGAKVILVPAHTSAEEVLKMQPDGVLLSNGPGDPAQLKNVAAEVAALIGKVPIFGIALGHQLLGMALGAQTQKLPFGHRGTQPVLNKKTGRIEMTVQNHNYCITAESLPPDVEISHVNLNDGTVEGLRHKKLPVFSVQFCTESGLSDTAGLLSAFVVSG